MLYFDLDGVIRSLSTGAIGREPIIWYEKVNGKDIFEIVDADKEILVNSPTTEYYPIINKLLTVNIISCQPKDWWDYTYRWLDIYLPQKYKAVFVDRPKEKFNYIKDGDALVEDHPNLPDYSQIILIDKPYNQDVKNPIVRIKTVKELEEALKKYI